MFYLSEQKLTHITHEENSGRIGRIRLLAGRTFTSPSLICKKVKG
jgi:hypothetical protein